MIFPIITGNFFSSISWINSPTIWAIIGALAFYVLFYPFTERVMNHISSIENSLITFPITSILFGGIGLILGLLIAALLAISIHFIEIPYLDQLVPIVATILFGYLGVQTGIKKREELTQLFGFRKRDFEVERLQVNSSKIKIFDTSVIIDGRIADICQTGFLEGTIFITKFVLAELQYIAESSDILKRNRGRRGLDILNRIQNDLAKKVEIVEEDFEEISEVDNKLIKLAKNHDGVVVTNDYNLNKICELQKIPVLNIHDLANAVKPIVLPSEELYIQVIKEGKEFNQGIAYLDDGTMIVVEDARDSIGKSIEIVVTSVLQTSAGRMIFAKPKMDDKAY